MIIKFKSLRNIIWNDQSDDIDISYYVYNIVAYYFEDIVHNHIFNLMRNNVCFQVRGRLLNGNRI